MPRPAVPPARRRRGLAASIVRLLPVLVPAGAAARAADPGPPPPVRAAACDAPAAAGWPRIRVLATGARSDAGAVAFTLYGDRPELFLKHAGALLVTRARLAGRTAEGCVAVPAPGRYAVAIYHDENDNHHFDRTLLGLPAEGYGFSNDAPTLLGPPAFAATRFAVPADGARIAVRLRY